MSDLLVLAIGATVVLQLTAAGAAVWLVHARGRRSAWALIAAALVVMALERAITFARHVGASDGAAHPGWLHMLALGGAALVLLGVVRVGTLLRGAQRSEEALLVQQAFLGRLFESAPEAIVTVDNEGRLLRANTEFTRLFGYTVDEVLGQSIDTLIAPGELHGEAADLTRRVAQGYTVTRETVRRRKDGTLVDVSIIGTPITIESGPVGVYGIYRDITERKRAENALRRSEARLRLLVEQMPAILWTTDRELRFTSTLGAGLQGLGMQPGEVVGKTLFEYFGTDDPKALPIAMHRRALEGQPASYEVNWGGNVYQSHVQPLHDDAGVVTGCVGAALDITERRRLEAQLRQAQKMEAVGQLTGGIAHDFNNLLTVIMANAEIVARTLAPSAEPREDIEDILAAAHRGTALIKKLLGFSRRTQLELRHVDLGRLVADVSAMLPRLVPEHIQIQLAGDETGVVEVDPNAIEQIVFNLVTNARDAMPDGGTLRIATGRRPLPDEQVAQHPRLSAGEYACLTVTDTGVGMNAATRERLFEPFFTTKPPGVGTGLGMAMIYGLVKQHNGYVEVVSAPGQGTTVRIYLPLSTDPATLPDVPVAPPRDDGETGSEMILVVEDEPAIRSAMKRALERHGYRVLVAADGEEALQTFRARQLEIDLVITDVIMPRMGGRDLYDAIRRLKSPVKVLFTSGYTARDLRESTYLDPAVPFLPKPWTITELFERVRGILSKGGEE